MKTQNNRITETIKVLKAYQAEYGVSFESAIRDWDEPWQFQYLFDILTEHYGKEPTPEHVCNLAGVNPTYWQQFMEGRL